MEPRYGDEVRHHLHSGGVVEIRDVLYVKDEGELKPGDTYIGAFNTVGVFTCDYVDTELGCVYSKEQGYPYDTCDCIKVCAIENRTADYVVTDEHICQSSR